MTLILCFFVFFQKNESCSEISSTIAVVGEVENLNVSVVVSSKTSFKPRITAKQKNNKKTSHLNKEKCNSSN